LRQRDSHATRLDAEAQETIRMARLHRKAITAIFFGVERWSSEERRNRARNPFCRAEPGLDIGNVETVLEALTEGCYYLAVERNRYHFSLKRTSTNGSPTVVQPFRLPRSRNTSAKKSRKCFPAALLQPIPFRRKQFRFQIVQPSVGRAITRQSLQDEKATALFVENMIRDTARHRVRSKVPSFSACRKRRDTLREDARKVLAWEAIDDDDLKLDKPRFTNSAENLKKARRDLKEPSGVPTRI